MLRNRGSNEYIQIFSRNSKGRDENVGGTGVVVLEVVADKASWGLKLPICDGDS